MQNQLADIETVVIEPWLYIKASMLHVVRARNISQFPSDYYVGQAHSQQVWEHCSCEAWARVTVGDDQASSSCDCEQIKADNICVHVIAAYGFRFPDSTQAREISHFQEMAVYGLLRPRFADVIIDFKGERPVVVAKSNIEKVIYSAQVWRNWRLGCEFKASFPDGSELVLGWFSAEDIDTLTTEAIYKCHFYNRHLLKLALDAIYAASRETWAQG